MSKSNASKFSAKESVAKNHNVYQYGKESNHTGAPKGYRNSQGQAVAAPVTHTVTKDTLGKQSNTHRKKPAVKESKSTAEYNKTYLYIGVAAAAFLILYTVYR